MTEMTGEYQAVCDGLRRPLKDHAATLAESPHEASVLTGAVVIQKYDSGCKYGDE